MERGHLARTMKTRVARVLPESEPMERGHLARTMKTRVARVLHDSMTATVLPTMSTPYNNEDRRLLYACRYTRRSSFPGARKTDPPGASLRRPTTFPLPAHFSHLNPEVSRGERLYLRAHRPDGAPIEVTGMVARVAPAIYGTARVGAQIVEPTENWLRLFVSWVADEQPATSDPESPSSE